MTGSLKQLDALYRSDLYQFVRKVFEELHGGKSMVESWHIQAMAWKLTTCVKGDARRVLIAMPPRYLKSMVTSVALALWILGRDPTAQIMCLSYSDDLAIKFANQRRQILESEWYRRMFPKTRISKKKDTEREIITTRGGTIFASSISGSITGRGADIIIIDDPLKAADADSEAERNRVNDTYGKVIYSRLNNKNTGTIVLVMQRLHEDDLFGHVQDKDNWQELVLPAIATVTEEIPISESKTHKRVKGELLNPKLEDEEAIATIKKTMASRIFEAQYQQTPTPAEGAMIKRSWLKFEKNIPEREDFDRVVIAWDTAFTISENADYSAFVVGGRYKNNVYILEAGRDRYEFNQLRNAIVESNRDWDPDGIIIEYAGSGISLSQSLHQKSYLPIIPVRPKVNKVQRLAAVEHLIETGRLILPEKDYWLGEFLAELLAFPGGKHDDQVDALAYLLSHIYRGLPGEIAMRVTNIRRGGDLYSQRTGIPIL